NLLLTDNQPPLSLYNPHSPSVPQSAPFFLSIVGSLGLLVDRMSRVYSLLLFISLVSFSVAFRTQAVAVKGKLMCGDKPAVGVLVKLFDEDDGPDPDDMLQSTNTGADGSFYLQGSAMELTPIDPEVRIYHDCNDHGRPCQREWVIRMPNKYIYSGTVAAKPMDLGVMNLEVELEAESHDCLH
ncbi:hypothetical protein PMAYCL1PPCAC_31008, partial [Pristionchus mayeri]